MEFVIKEEFWYISAFLNTIIVDGDTKSGEIETVIKKHLSILKNEDLFYKIRDDFGADIFDMAKNLSLSCSWVPTLTSFPYEDENNQEKYDTLGFFQFEVEYYKNEPEKKENIKSNYIQQIPQMILNYLKEYSKKEENKGVLFDLKSPIYIFLISDNIKPDIVEWTLENIKKYKKIISYYTEIYSGQWEDYSEKLYDKRIRHNLSNRKSELHFICRNSGFIYMAKENYKNFFDSYMKRNVLTPTPNMRAAQFALRSINESLDLLFLKTQLGGFLNVKVLEDKQRNLRLLRGLIQTNLSLIYNELYYNRRQHYTSVLKHLLKEFDIAKIVKRINEKFNIIYDSISEMYKRKNEEIQKRTEKGFNLLYILFGAGILADLGGVIMIALSLSAGDLTSILLNGIIAIIITGILVLTIGFNIYTKFQAKEANIGRTVDAVIEDGKGNIVFIRRKFPPFKNYLALPGGFVEAGEKLEQALIREVREETNLNIIIVEKIGVYDDEGRDPRGNIRSTAFRCKIKGNISNIKSRDESREVKLVPKEQIKDLKLAFDHKKIVKDADVIKREV